jgi:hypothetical protein
LADGPVTRHKVLRLALAALVVGLSGGVSGCSNIIGCSETRFEAEPVVVDDPGQPVTYSARLVDDGGEPLAGRTVKFFTMTGPDEADGAQAGEAETDEDGWARLELDGIYGQAHTGDTVSRYTVDFWPIGAVDGETYCRATGEAPITCRTADGEGTCPPAPSPFDE